MACPSADLTASSEWETGIITFDKRLEVVGFRIDWVTFSSLAGS
jgi:hypothetical protein